jgi:hypothetical protein
MNAAAKLRDGLCGAVVALMITACSSVPAPVAATQSAAVQGEADLLATFRADAGEPVARFSLIGAAGRINNWAALGDQALAVWPLKGQGYLLELHQPCQNLPRASNIVISNAAGVVVAGSDDVTIQYADRFRRSDGPMRIEQCRIDVIRPLDDAGISNAQRYRREGAVIHPDAAHPNSDSRR